MANDDTSLRYGVNRRWFLKGAGGATAAGLLAGCMGDGGAGDGSGDGGTGGDGGDGSGDGGTGGDGGDGGSGDGGSEWPTQPVTLVVPYGTGGGYDFYTRLVAKYLTEKDYLPVDVKVQNVEGAGGIVAANQVYNAEPDGYTNMIMNTESFALPQIVQPDAVRYEMKGFTYLPRVAGTTRSIGVSTDTDITTGEEFIEALQNGEILIGNQGAVSDTAFMLMVLGEVSGLFSAEQYKQNSVVFDDRGETYTAMKRGDVQAMSGSFSSLLPYVQSGDMRFVLVYTMEDSPPEGTKNQDCDTLKTLEMSVKDPETIIALSGGPYHRIFGGPPDIPEDRVTILREAFTSAIKDPDLQAEAEKADRPIFYGSSEVSRKGAIETLEAYKNHMDLLREAGLID